MANKKNAWGFYVGAIAITAGFVVPLNWLFMLIAFGIIFAIAKDPV